ncbi:DegT/DnrJ/EryC1/StrS family aminotransferase [Streptomyces sp. enrichment culture]|uniref:DegT/DnrJ/EryC1/StrS family aminotransferase n=1 Tax=Streptomyces sp. enrichment culture TaxID=1795815 RepID=UPI003F56B616
MMTTSSGPIPYSRPFWTAEERDVVTRVIESGMWTNGVSLAAFEQALAESMDAPHAVCFSSGTAAIHALLAMLRKPAGNGLVVTSTLNFAAVPASARLLGYDVAFTDIDRATLNMAPESLEELLHGIGARYDQIVVFPVHFAGLPADLTALRSVADRFGAVLAEDACHAAGAHYEPGGRPVGGHPGSTAAAFSFHPTKPVAAAEGGALTLRDDVLADKLRAFRNHNMRRPHTAGAEAVEPWSYEIYEPGLNLRLSDIHAAIGLVQLRRLPESLARRRTMARRYRAELSASTAIRSIPDDPHELSALHLFPVEFNVDRLGMTKAAVYDFFLAAGIRLQVHYTPLHRFPAFSGLPTVRDRWFPVCDDVMRGTFSLPMYFGLGEGEQQQVIDTVRDLARKAPR